MPARAPSRALLLLAAIAVLALMPAVAACGILPPLASEASPVVGQGDVQAEDRQLDAYTRVSVGAGMKVVIGAGDVAKTTVEAQANLLPLIKTQVVEGQLVVTIPAPGVSTSEAITLTLVMPELTSIALSAGATGYLEHTGGPLNVDVSGGAVMTAIGSTPSLTLTASSGANAKLGELKAETAKITVSDGSSAQLTVTSSVTGTATGGATVVLTSKPATVSIEATSGATVQGG